MSLKSIAGHTFKMRLHLFTIVHGPGQPRNLQHPYETTPVLFYVNKAL